MIFGKKYLYQLNLEMEITKFQENQLQENQLQENQLQENQLQERQLQERQLREIDFFWNIIMNDEKKQKKLVNMYDRDRNLFLYSNHFMTPYGSIPDKKMNLDPTLNHKQKTKAIRKYYTDLNAKEYKNHIWNFVCKKCTYIIYNNIMSDNLIYLILARNNVDFLNKVLRGYPQLLDRLPNDNPSLLSTYISDNNADTSIALLSFLMTYNLDKFESFIDCLNPYLYTFNITSDSKLDNVRCQYIILLRREHNRFDDNLFT
jgi:hypothetical protein